MKFNKIIITAALAGVVFGGSISCTANYEDLNKNPYEPDDEEIGRDDYNIRAALLALQEWVVPANDVNGCQFTDLLMGGSWGGYFADSQPSFNGGKFSTYNQPEGWNKVMYQDIIPKLYPNYKKLQIVTDNPVPLSVGLIVKVAAMHRIADCYGPIPYSKVGADGKLTAPLDSQQEAYNAMFTELDEAIEALSGLLGESLSTDADKVFGGNLTKWVKFANSLKLRMAMRIVYADPATAQAKAEEAINHTVGVMTSTDDNAAFSGFGKDGNPFYKVMYEYNGGDSRVGADITALMNSYADPRRAAYFTTSAFTTATNGFYGLRSGITVPASEIAHQYSNAVLTASSPLQWMNAAEVAFLRAEGALRGWNMGGTAESLYRQGIELSFQQWGVAGAADYQANTNLPAGYKDPLGSFSYNGAVSSITVAWDGAADFETNLERIITQKWIANFSLGQEAWAEYRRTGYPRLMPVVQNLSSGGVVKSDEGPRRLSYPLDEYSTNGENLNAAVAAYLDGPDNMATRVWWDCKPKNN